ncbi:NAD(P) transhydrogenase subunit alpha [Pirellulimonas nuda]|uniref:proton-translocating NAD(P)(+) transhydrogenase n=1 Tax=Pirellulimonas nuda TaxID=2528009 RepID=A0A518DJ14_9BACT|nr:NAD(P) transhydrogenase subunit alpha [Pirellulimonas nuda]QDU91458.1 NAD(P) transhydrogenase subunit alpha [Pirellulimonas nuda]
MIVAVPSETFPGERRVALTPQGVQALAKQSLHTHVQSGAGMAAGYPDEAYRDAGAVVVPQRDELFGAAEIIVQVRTLGANPAAGRQDLELFRAGQVLIGAADPLGDPSAARDIAATGATLFALELAPRITRAQSIDILSSMATIAGYKAMILAADRLPKLFPLLMTAAGTITPAKVLVLGAGVAGLQAIATAKRLGAVVSAYDVRPAAREQIESVGAKCVELDLATGDAEGQGGYAKALTEEQQVRQREQLADVVSGMDVVVTTAAIPGRPSPVLVTAAAVRRMAPGSVIIDLAAERGGNCELTIADQEVIDGGVTILGPTNLASAAPYHASAMYGRNIAAFLKLIVKEGKLAIDLEDEIVRETLVCRDGEVVNERIKQLLQGREY